MTTITQQTEQTAWDRHIEAITQQSTDVYTPAELAMLRSVAPANGPLLCTLTDGGTFTARERHELRCALFAGRCDGWLGVYAKLCRMPGQAA